MLEHIYYFTKGILSYKHEVPIYLQISGFLALGVLATCIIFIFGDNLNMSIFKDSYMIYYFLVMINIINIIVVLYYYSKKSGRFIGEQGEKGDKGRMGEVGTEVDCSLCNHNIYMQKVQRYDTISRLDTNTFLNRLLGEDSKNSLLNDLLESDSFDYTEFASSLLVDGFDMENNTVRNIFNYVNAFEFLLYNNVNNNLGVSGSDVTGYFRRPYGKVGYYALGDTCMGGMEEYATTSYAVNGDIILPEGFNHICTFSTINEDGDADKYGIYKMVPPEWAPLVEDDIPKDARDLTRRTEKDETEDKYLSLGYVVAPLTSDGMPDKQLFACVKRSCCKKLSKSKMKLLFVYPAISSMDINTNNNSQSDSNLNNANNGNNNSSKTKMVDAPGSLGVFSVWRTPFNTIFVKYVDSTKLMYGNSVVEQMYLNMGTGQVSESLYTRYGTIKRVIKERVKAFLNRIRLDKIVILGILFNHIFEKVSKMLKQYYDEFIGSGKKEIPNTVFLKSKLGKSQPSLEYNDIPKLLSQISRNITETKSKLFKKQQQQIAKIQKKRILNLGEFESDTKSKIEGISYNAVKRFEQIRTEVANLTVGMENCETMLDVVNSIFDGGIDTTLEEGELTYSQEVILFVASCLLQPEEDIWILKNSCLVYEQVNEERIALQNSVGEEVKRINFITKTIGTKAEAQCGAKDLERINDAVEKTYEKIMKQIGHIPNALGKLNKLDLEEFSNQQLEFVLGEIKKLVLYIESKCS